MKSKNCSLRKKPINPKTPKLATAAVVPKKCFITPKTAIGKTICGKRSRIFLKLKLFFLPNVFPLALRSIGFLLNAPDNKTT